METFEFYQDQKVTAWDRVHFSVTAPDLETAKAKLEVYREKEIENDENLGIEISHCEYQPDTSEQITVEENGGCSTLEMYTEDGDEVMDNAPEPCPPTIYRCCECGSTDVQIKAWVDPNNSNKYISETEDTGDNWCDSCEQHPRVIPHTELMKDIDLWWEQCDGEDIEVITGLDDNDFESEEEYDIACQACWNEKTNDQKIEIWRTITKREE